MPKGTSPSKIGGLLFTLVVLWLWLTVGQVWAAPLDPTRTDPVFVVLKDQADTTNARDISDRAERVRYVYRTLTQHAQQTQASLRAFLEQRKVAYKPYYLVNGVTIVADAALRNELSARDDVAFVLVLTRPRPGDAVENNRDLFVSLQPTTYDAENPPWGITFVSAPRVWDELKIRGQGIIIGSGDTGADWKHPALRPSYAGSDGNHDYTWFDPWDNTAEPFDDGGHGTHTIGTMTGANKLGVAPDAKWIACRNMSSGIGNAAMYVGCMQFLFAPFPQGADPLTQGDPLRGAHVTNNSWGCPNIEGCNSRELTIALAHLYNAGQMNVFAAGNSGSTCSSVGNPAFSAGVVAVGAINNRAQIAYFSSRGPILIDGSRRTKPDVSAPGVDVLSAFPNNRYMNASGTSMAAPHTAGTLALMFSANPSLIGDLEGTKALLFKSAKPVTPEGTATCGEAGTPNNVYGWGNINAYDAVLLALDK
jgi:subtilisin family serine protease